MVFGYEPTYVLSGQETEASLRQTYCYDVICYFLLFAWSFNQFTIFSIKTFSSARYHLSGQVTEASLGQSDSLIALYPFFVFCFSLLDQFVTWLVINIFKCWITLNYFLEILNFRRFVVGNQFRISFFISLQLVFYRTSSYYQCIRLSMNQLISLHLVYSYLAKFSLL